MRSSSRLATALLLFLSAHASLSNVQAAVATGIANDGSGKTGMGWGGKQLPLNMDMDSCRPDHPRAEGEGAPFAGLWGPDVDWTHLGDDQVLQRVGTDPVGKRMLIHLSLLAEQSESLEDAEREQLGAVRVPHRHNSEELMDRAGGVASLMQTTSVGRRLSGWVERVMGHLDTLAQVVATDRAFNQRSVAGETGHLARETASMLLVKPALKLTSGPEFQRLIELAKPQITPLVEGGEGGLGRFFFLIFFFLLALFVGAVIAYAVSFMRKEGKWFTKAEDTEKLKPQDFSTDQVAYLLRARCESIKHFDNEELKLSKEEKKEVTKGRQYNRIEVLKGLHLLETSYPKAARMLPRNPGLEDFKALGMSSAEEEDPVFSLLRPALSVIAKCTELMARKRAMFCDAFNHPKMFGVTKYKPFYDGEGVKDFGQDPTCAPLLKPDPNDPTKGVEEGTEYETKPPIKRTLERLRDDFENAVPLFVSDSCLKDVEDIGDLAEHTLKENEIDKLKQPDLQCDDASCYALKDARKEIEKELNKLFETLKNKKEAMKTAQNVGLENTFPEMFEVEVNKQEQKQGLKLMFGPMMAAKMFSPEDAGGEADRRSTAQALVKGMIYMLRAYVDDFCRFAHRLSLSGICPENTAADSETFVTQNEKTLPNIAGNFKKLLTRDGDQPSEFGHLWGHPSLLRAHLPPQVVAYANKRTSDRSKVLRTLIHLVQNCTRQGKMDLRTDQLSYIQSDAGKASLEQYAKFTGWSSADYQKWVLTDPRSRLEHGHPAEAIVPPGFVPFYICKAAAPDGSSPRGIQCDKDGIKQDGELPLAWLYDTPGEESSADSIKSAPNPDDESANEAVMVSLDANLINMRYGVRDHSVLTVAWWLAWNFSMVKHALSILERSRQHLKLAELFTGSFDAYRQWQSVAVAVAVDPNWGTADGEKTNDKLDATYTLVKDLVKKSVLSPPDTYSAASVVQANRDEINDGSEDDSGDKAMEQSQLYLRYSHLVYKALVGLPK